MSAKQLIVEDWTLVYNPGTPKQRLAINKVSFSVEKGEFLAIVGPSGSGKSTLLYSITRLRESTPGKVYTSGKIYFNGIDITALRPSSKKLRQIRSQMPMVFQQFHLQPRLSVLTNVLIGSLGYTSSWRTAFYRFSGKDRELALKNLKRVGIAEHAHKRASELSGGEQQRTGLARAFMQKEAEILLADEPVSNLDPALAHSVMKFLKEQNQKGITVLCALHLVDLAECYGTRAIGIKDGKIVFDGSPSEINDDRVFKQIYGEEAQRLGVR